jgi:predicted component of type VI protein secretion system
MNQELIKARCRRTIEEGRTMVRVRVEDVEQLLECREALQAIMQMLDREDDGAAWRMAAVESQARAALRVEESALSAESATHNKP